MDETIVCHDLHLRHTGTDGRTRAERYRVWDATRFLEARESECQKLNAERREKARASGAPVDGIDASVTLISAATFQRERAARR